MKMDISDKIEQIKDYAKNAEGLQKNSLVYEPFLRDLKVRLSWNSNAIEGNTLSLDETIAVIEYDEVHSGHTYTEYQEAKNMYRAVTEKLDMTGKKIPDIEWIKSVNATIIDSDGEFRNKDVYIGSLAEVVYYPPKYTEVPGLMRKFLDRSWVGAGITEETIVEITKTHIEFERIHPFADGNGRTGRMLMNQQLLNAGMFPAIIKDQSKYRQAFRRYERSGEISLMNYVIAEGILETYKKLEMISRNYLDSFRR